MAVTCRPQDFRIVPTLLAMIPLPIPEMTPPVTRMYFIIVLWYLVMDDRLKPNENKNCKHIHRV